MPNGNDKWEQFKDKDAGTSKDKWAQYADKPTPARTNLEHAASTAPEQPNSVLGGFGRRAVDTAKGLYETFKPASAEDKGEQAAVGLTGPGGLALYRMGKNALGAYKQKATDLATDISTGSYGKAALHGAQLIPGSPIGPMSPTGSLVDTAAEGRYKEALGGAAFDATTMLVGKLIGKMPKTPKRIAKLTAATGKMTEGTAPTIEHILPELDKTAREVGKPSSVGDYEKLVQKTLDRSDTKFNAALQPIKNDMVDTRPVAQRILGLVKSDASPEEIAAIRKAASEYAFVNKQGEVTAPKPQKMQWLEDRRGRLNAATSSIWNKGSGAAATAVRSDLDLAIDRAARNAVADLQYDEMERAYPGRNFREIKAQQKSLWALKDQLGEHIKDLTDKEQIAKGRTFREKYSPHGYVGRHIGAYVSGSPVDTHPLALADIKTRQAFGTSGPRRAAMSAVLGSPVSRLSTPQSSTIPPPPPEPPK
jgi:hypothetical protein